MRNSSSAAASSLDYRADIDGLRALAVLAVVAFHAFPSKLAGGFVGVDVFFVISGFLISGLILRALQQGRFSYLDFYARRIRRIFPALFVVLATCLIAGWSFLYANEYKELGREAAAGAGFVANLLFWSESGYFDIEARSKPLLHLWSLGIEEQFYIAWPLLLAFFYRRRGSVRVLVLVMLLASFCWNVHQVHADPVGAFYLPMSRFWELLLGAMLAHESVLGGGAISRAVSAPGPVGREVLALLGASLLVASLLLINETRAFPGWWALLPTMGTLCLIAAQGAKVNRVVLSNRVVVFIGLISYPLYLWHWVLLTAADHAAKFGRLDRMATVGVSFLLAWLTYELVEKPIRFRHRTPARTLALAAGVALIGLVGWMVYATDGAAFRFPPAVRSLVTYHYDAQRAYREGLCQLDNDEPFAALAAQCLDPPLEHSRLLVLWGDSHASSLYPGLRAAVSTRPGWRLAQFTASGCPPLPAGEFGRHRTCQSFDQAALSRIRQLRPDVVVLAGYWLDYARFNGEDAEASALHSSVIDLQAAGVGRIVVFGSLPRWRLEQPTVSLHIWQQTGLLATRTPLYLEPATAEVDAALVRALAGTRALFISPIAELCNQDGCPLRAGQTLSVPVAWDSSHLTTEGSKLLVGLSAMRIFGDQ